MPAPRLSDSRVGLCAMCAHARVVKNDRGSRFWRCERSFEDPAFPRYPRLPVVACRGFEAARPEERPSLAE